MASDDEGESWEALRQSRNRKDKKAGGWQAMGLDYGVFKGIDKKGFRMPTPIQRKTIPCIMDGKDVVGMSRTGSGKTAAFVVPMLHRLKRRDTKGIRAMLISPTRELALQTHKVIKELGRFTGLEAACLVGGDSMDDQFATLHESPDILVATPGRLLHIVVEMNLRLNAVEYIVFDEADRLFEMGFREQLADILKRLPESRQTLLFSATLPKMLVDFAKAGLTDPMLIRLDVDEKVSELLSMIFVTCRPNDRTAAAVHLARKAVNERKQTVMFCATMKHVEYYVAILQKANIDCSFIYSQLDPTARKINISRFRNKETFLLIVTDVAARGVDIPLLDTVINVHFPPKPKLFVHRAGRVARAGQPGTAISLVAADELPYMVDLFLFLGRPMVFAKDKDEHDEKVTMIGRLPDRIVDLESDFLTSIADTDIDLHDLEHKSGMALGKYGRTRPAPSAESARRVKAEVRAAVQACSYHPALREATDRQQTSVLNALANYKSSTTIFEVHSNSKDTQVTVMKNMRRMNAEKIRARQEEEEKKKVAADEEAERAAAAVANQADEATLANAFTELISKSGKKLNRRERMEEEKKLHFISYNAEDARGEAALAVDFSRAAEGASVDIIADDERGLYKQKNEKKWDRKTKRFVGAANDDPSKKKIRTEDGTWIPASYKSGVYEKWVQKRKLGFEKKDGDSDNEGGDDGDDYTDRGVNMDDDSGKPKHHQRRWGKNGGQKGGEERGDGGRKIRNEVLKPEQILKNRKKLLAKQDYQAYRRDENLKKKMNSSGGSRGGKGGRGGGKPIGKAGGGGRISKPGMGGGSKFGAGGRGGFKGGRGGGGRTGGGGG
ncbi:hypothetical protein PFISCL1PPCAC_15905, partial [Pristionchus fissidentatus]